MMFNHHSPMKPLFKINDRQPYNVTISTVTVLKVIGILVGLFFLWYIRNVVGIIFVAIVLASAVDPWVDRLARYRIPRWVTILCMYLFFILVLGLTVYLLIPPLTQQISDIAFSLRQYTPQIEAFYRSITGLTDTSLTSQLQQGLTNLNTMLSNLTTGFVGVVTSFVGRIFTIIIVLVITFYMTIEEDGIKKFVRSIAPIKYQPYLVQKTNRIQTKMGGWLRGQLIVMLIVGVMSFIGLTFLRVPYALVLAIVAGLLEFIPFLGPVIAAIPAVFFAYTDSPWKALGVVIMYIVLQQVENQIIVPKIMQKVVGLNPIIVIAAMLIGAKLVGIAGIILAVPATTIAWIFLEDLFYQKKERDNKLETPIIPPESPK